MPLPSLARLAPLLHRLLGWQWLLLLLAIALVMIGWWGSARPVLVIASGPEGGYFHSTALHYQALLQARGVEVKVLPQEHTLMGLAAVNDPGSSVQMGFMAQRALASDYPRVRSLGVISDEPLFVFRRAGVPRIEQLQQLKGMRLAVGVTNSGTRQLSEELLAAHGITASNAHFFALPLRASAQALRDGQVDVAFILQPLELALVRELGRTPGIELDHMVSAKAMARTLADGRTMSLATIPRGVFDLSADRPHSDVDLPATAVSVVVKQSLDPGVLHHVLVVMKQVHGGAGIDRDAGRYPRAVTTQVPLHALADSYYRNGLPLLYQYLPFGLAGRMFHGLLLLLPLSLLAPVLSFLGVPPPLDLHRALRYRLWLTELRHMLKSYTLNGQLSKHQRRRLGELRRLMQQHGSGLDLCRESAARLPE